MKKQKEERLAVLVAEAKRKEGLGPLGRLSETMVDSFRKQWAKEGYSGFEKSFGL
jgi:hypothetical protein